MSKLPILDLCGACVYRADSRRRVISHLTRHNGQVVGFILDPQPRAECKMHEGYGVDPAHSKAGCRDFVFRAEPRSGQEYRGEGDVPRLDSTAVGSTPTSVPFLASTRMDQEKAE